ncbi:polyphenol oxidase family protein [Actinomyces sp. MRS3W]|uniref:polyphenol oxidase family protein n=1 Tax=Actinomyces sp. MRS3W TaxID=2800796 RepID=UPI0028FD77D4|nr:polyphenol oxidase family protein [Actinomyces sp. MRS3W]MDU0347889.1 polyphenol oxidase family protein [Actinomyces sp. MRS3W]
MAEHTAGLIAVELGVGARGYFTTRSMASKPVVQGDPYAGFNLALHVGDEPDRVRAHRAALEQVLGLGAPAGRRRGIAWMNQVHSARIAPAALETTPTADALLLNTREAGHVTQVPAAAAVLVADCAPVLLASADGTMVAAVHAGRAGTLSGIIPAAIAALSAVGVEPAGIHAVIGPTICGACYEVSAELHALAAQTEPACATTTRWGTPGIDLVAGITAQLERAGVHHVSRIGRCTYEDEELYSYRRCGVTGRQAGIAVAAGSGM